VNWQPRTISRPFWATMALVAAVSEKWQSLNVTAVAPSSCATPPGLLQKLQFTNCAARAGGRHDARIRLPRKRRELPVRHLDADGLNGVYLNADMAAVRPDPHKLPIALPRLRVDKAIANLCPEHERIHDIFPIGPTEDKRVVA